MTIQFIQEDFYYADYCQGVAIGDTGAANTYAWENYGEYAETVVINSIYSIIDSGATAIMISTLYYENFI